MKFKIVANIIHVKISSFSRFYVSQRLKMVGNFSIAYQELNTVNKSSRYKKI
jgi:hypothetical protein